MNHGKLLFALAVGACSFSTSPALAQFTQPVQLQAGETRNASLDKSSPVLKNTSRYDCYAISTTASEEITVTLESSAFDPAIEIARGALCHAYSLQYENDNVDDSTTTARVSFNAAGGRYLVIVKSKSPDAVGAYRLQVGGDVVQQAAVKAPSAEKQRRQQIMEVEIAKREAELAAAEAKRKAEQAAYEARQAELLAYSSTDDSDYEDDYYEEEYEAPQRNPFMVFAETLSSELAKQQQAEDEFQQGLEQAIRRGEAERQRRVAAEQAAEARRVAALQKSQAAERARIEAEAAQRRAEEKARMLNRSTTSNAMRNPNTGLTAKPVASSNTSAPTSTGRASTKSDPHLCISRPQQVRNPNCKDGTAFRVTNSCEGPVDLRVCIRTVKGQWDCGVQYGIKAGATAGWPSCFGTSDVFVSARHSDSDIPLASPP